MPSKPKLTKWQKSNDHTGIVEFNYPNGLRLLVLERHHLPIVTVSTWYKIGGKHLFAGKTGMAHLVEHLMFKGTTNLKKGEIDLITQQLGGNNNAFTSSDYTGYYFNFPSKYWERALEIEADRMLNCLWTPEEFASEKSVILEELGTSQDSPFEVLVRQAEEICYQVHPYRYPILGFLEDLKKVTLEETYQFYQEYYHPSNATIVVVGDVEKDKVAKKVHSLFGSYTKKLAPPSFCDEKNSLGQKRIQIKQTVEIARFVMMFLTSKVGTREDYVLDLIDIILSSGRSSRLYQRFIKEEQILQSISSYSDTRVERGLFWLTGSVMPGVNPETVEKKIQEEITKLKQKAVTKAELERAKNIFLTEFLFDQENNFDLASRIGEMQMYGDFRYISKALEIIPQVTPKEIQLIANEYLNFDHATVAWSIPKSPQTYNRKRAPKKKESQKRLPQSILKRNLTVSPQLTTSASSIIDKQGNLKVKSHTLSNGMTIMVLANGSLPIVSTEVFSKLVLDEPGKEGCGALSGRMLMDGSKEYEEKRIHQVTDFIGANFNTSSSGISFKSLSQDFDYLLKMSANILQNPLAKASTLRREKEKLLTRLLAQKENPYHIGQLAFLKMIYKSHPYSQPSGGTPESIKDIQISDVRNYYQKRFQPSRMAILVVGNIQAETVFASAERYFGNWTDGTLPQISYPRIQVAKKSKSRNIYMDKKQIVLYWGHLGVRRSTPDYYKLLMLDQILGQGSGFTDRLAKKIRDELGLCYSIECSTTFASGKEPGMVIANLTTSLKNYEKAKDTLIQEIQKIKSKKVTKKELENAKSYLTQSFIFGLEENDSLLSFLVRMYVYDLPKNQLQKAQEKIKKVEVEDILEVAKKYLHPEIATTVAVGPIRNFSKS